MLVFDRCWSLIEVDRDGTRCADMDDFIPIQYRDFFDVPRMFIVVHDRTTYLFDSSFDEALDDYRDAYHVSILPRLNPEELAGSWASMPSRAIGQLSPVKVSAVRFDQARRQGVQRSFLCSVILGAQPSVMI
jgi:hypothetical protein